MLLINDVKLSMLPKNDKFVIIYDNVRRAMMEQYGKTIVLNFPLDKIKTVNTVNAGTLLETPSGYLQKAYKRYVTSREEYEVRYYVGQKQMRNGVIKYNPVYINFNGKMSLDVRSQFDLIFFMIFVSPVCGLLNDDILRKYQNLQRGDIIHYVLYDEVKEATEQINMVRLTSEIEALVTSDSIGLSHKMLRQFAIGYGLIDPFKEVHIDTVRKLLLGYLLVRDRAGRIDSKRVLAFKNDSKTKNRLDVRQLIKEAVNVNVLEVRRQGMERHWCLLTKDGNIRNNICVCNYYQDYESTLEDYLVSDENHAMKEEIAKLVEMKKAAMDTALDIELDRSSFDLDYMYKNVDVENKEVDKKEVVKKMIDDEDADKPKVKKRRGRPAKNKDLETIIH